MDMEMYGGPSIYMKTNWSKHHCMAASLDSWRWFHPEYCRINYNRHPTKDNKICPIPISWTTASWQISKESDHPTESPNWRNPPLGVMIIINASWLKVMTSFNVSWISKCLRAQRHHPREEDRVGGSEHPNCRQLGSCKCSLSPHTWSRLIPGRDSTSLSLPTQTMPPKNNYNVTGDPKTHSCCLKSPPPLCIYSKYAILCY